MCEWQDGKRLMIVWVTRWKTPDDWVTRWKTFDDCVNNKKENAWWLCEWQDLFPINEKHQSVLHPGLLPGLNLSTADVSHKFPLTPGPPDCFATSVAPATMQRLVRWVSQSQISAADSRTSSRSGAVGFRGQPDHVGFVVLRSLADILGTKEAHLSVGTY